MTENIELLSAQERSFASQLRRLRTDGGWSQDQFAERLRAFGLAHVTQSTISRIENAQRPVRLAEAQAIASILGVPLSAMTDPDERMEMLRLISVNVRNMSSSSSRFYALGREIAYNRQSARETLRELDRLFADRSSLDNEALSEVEELRETLLKIIDTDPGLEVARLVREASKSRG